MKTRKRRTASALAVLFAAAAAFFGVAGDTAAQNSNEASPVTAFSKLVEAGSYEDANFYLTNKFVTAENIDTAQLFVDVVMAKYVSDMAANAKAIDTLYNYLAAIEPIDLNRPLSCGRYESDKQPCLFVNILMGGADRDTIAYFVERGLDLNGRVTGIVPATVPLLLRLGTAYSLSDLNYFASNGMVLGDELYPIEELANYRDRQSYYSQLNMPTDYLSLRDQNFLDVLVIALGTRMESDMMRESARRKTLCDFIAYAAPSFSPSFDYLQFLLQTIEDFRGPKIGKLEKYGRDIYQPFPDSCVALVRNMAASHAKLQDVISRFAGEGDVETANWLIMISKKSN